MEQKKFEAMLVLIVPEVIGLITKNIGLDEMTATRVFMNLTCILCWSRKIQNCGNSVP